MARKKPAPDVVQTDDDTVAAIAASFGLGPDDVALVTAANTTNDSVAPIASTSNDEVDSAISALDDVPDFLKGDPSHVMAEAARREEAANAVTITDHDGSEVSKEYDRTFDPHDKGGPLEGQPRPVAAAGVGFEVSTDPAPVAASEENDEEVLSNNGNLTRKDFDKEVRKLGTAMGRGKNSLPALGLRTLEALNRVTDMNAKDRTLPEVIFNEFMAKASEASGLERGVMSSHKAQLSKFRQFFDASHTGVDSYNMMLRALDKIKELQDRDDKPLKGGTYEAMVTVARAQKSVQDRELYDAEIEQALIKDKKEKSELEKLGDLLKSVRKAHDWAPQGAKPGIEDAAHNLEDAIRALGGNVPEEKPDSEEGGEE